MSMKDVRSMVSCIARRISGLSKGGASRLSNRLIATMVGSSSQIASGACALTSRSDCTVPS
jgi:hypothetical protein